MKQEKEKMYISPRVKCIEATVKSLICGSLQGNVSTEPFEEEDLSDTIW